MLSSPLTPLLIVVPILMVDAIIELSFVSAMVGFLKGRAGKPWDVTLSNGTSFEMKAVPHGELVNQGHTSNGAAGTAFVLIGLGGLLVIWLQKRRIRRDGDSRPHPLFSLWVVCTILSVLLTLGALIYTFVLTYDHNDQTIDLSVLAANSYPNKYPLDDWTPENWFSAIRDQVPLTNSSDRSKIRTELATMRGWRWNLIPLFVIGLLTAAVAVWEWSRLRRTRSFKGETAKQGAF